MRVTRLQSRPSAHCQCASKRSPERIEEVTRAVAPHNVMAFRNENKLLDRALVEQVEYYPVLWDPNTPLYRNSDHRKKVWQDIADQLNSAGISVSADRCKVRFKSLRDVYGRMLKKNQPATGSIFQHLHFLKGFIVNAENKRKYSKRNSVAGLSLLESEKDFEQSSEVADDCIENSEQNTYADSTDIQIIKLESDADESETALDEEEENSAQLEDFPTPPTFDSFPDNLAVTVERKRFFPEKRLRLQETTAGVFVIEDFVGANKSTTCNIKTRQELNQNPATVRLMPSLQQQTPSPPPLQMDPQHHRKLYKQSECNPSQEKMESEVPSSSGTKDDIGTDPILDYIGRVLKALPYNLRLKAKNELFAVLLQYEKQYLES